MKKGVRIALPSFSFSGFQQTSNSRQPADLRSASLAPPSSTSSSSVPSLDPCSLPFWLLGRRAIHYRHILRYALRHVLRPRENDLERPVIKHTAARRAGPRQLEEYPHRILWPAIPPPQLWGNPVGVEIQVEVQGVESLVVGGDDENTANAYDRREEGRLVRAWSMVDGRSLMVHGRWLMVHGRWTIVVGCWLSRRHDRR